MEQIRIGSVLKNKNYKLLVTDISDADIVCVKMLESNSRNYPIGWTGLISYDKLSGYEIDNSAPPEHEHVWQKYHGFTEKYLFCECGCTDYKTEW